MKERNQPSIADTQTVEQLEITFDCSRTTIEKWKREFKLCNYGTVTKGRYSVAEIDGFLQNKSTKQNNLHKAIV